MNVPILHDMNVSKLTKSIILACALSACDSLGDGPDPSGVTIAIQSGDAQFGTAGATLLDPLQVVVTDPVTKDPVEGATVNWSVVAGNGAVLSPSASETDENGVATTTLRLGSALGEYIVEARANAIVGTPPRFRARAVETPVITSVPAFANVGDTITIAGRNFSTQGDDNIVQFGGFRAKVITATTTQLRAVVPACVPARVVPLTASLGVVASTPVSIEVRGNTVTSLQLGRGEVLTVNDPNELGCFRLPGGIAGYTVLLIPQNYSEVAGTTASMRLSALSGSTTVTDISLSRPLAPGIDLATTFETKLRVRGQQMLQQNAGVNLRPQHSSVAACGASPAVGSRCAFQVIDKDNQFVSVTADLKAISDRAYIYQDITAPANGLTFADFQSLGRSFDDPIFDAVSGAFGAPGDIDSNGKVIILLTPVVNAMTPKGSPGFIAGFFYGCDLVTRSVCPGSNGAEVFYTMTADPAAQFSDARSVTTVLRSLPPVLGHEFQHMIHFGLRLSADALWISEGLAHHAEDIVADVFEARGDATTAAQYRAQNYTRANRYLRDPANTSLIAENGTGTLEMRGAAWLFVKYLVTQYGAPILRAITAASESSVTNVERQTSRSWSALLANWAIALYADDAPELSGVTIRREFSFPGFNLRQAIGGSSFYPLRPATQSFSDFTLTQSLPASSQLYLQVQATSSNAPALSLNLAGPLGGGFPLSAAPQLSILRLQ